MVSLLHVWYPLDGDKIWLYKMAAPHLCDHDHVINVNPLLINKIVVYFLLLFGKIFIPTDR